MCDAGHVHPVVSLERRWESIVDASLNELLEIGLVGVEDVCDGGSLRLSLRVINWGM